MKKGLIVLLIFILVVGAFFAGTGFDFKKSTTVSDENNTAEPTAFEDVYYEEPCVDEEISSNNLSKFVGIWENYDSNGLNMILSINAFSELYLIIFDENDFGWSYVKYYKEEICEISDDGFSTGNEYVLLNENTLRAYNGIGGEFEKRSEGSTNLLIGTWYPYNYEKFNFNIINHAIGRLSEFIFYSDGTYRLFNDSGSECNGKYSVVNDGKALEFEYNGDSDIYDYELIGNGLLILSNSIRDRNEGRYCLLELY